MACRKRRDLRGGPPLPNPKRRVINSVAVTRCCQKLLSAGASLGQDLISGRGLAYSEIGARTRIRTRDQLIKSQLLYQLSYAGSDHP